MSKKRRKFTAEFKGRVALDTLPELASKPGAHPNQASQWKKQAMEQFVAEFAGKAQKAQQSDEARIKKLHATTRPHNEMTHCGAFSLMTLRAGAKTPPLYS